MEKFITEKSEDYALLDKHTGEILDYTIHKKINLDEFIMVFFTSFPEIMSLEGQKLKVLMMCWKESTYRKGVGNIIVNDLEFKERVREYSPDISNLAVNVAVSTLVKKGLLLKMCKGKYRLNPTYFFQGKLSERTHLMMNFEVQPQKGVVA